MLTRREFAAMIAASVGSVRAFAANTSKGIAAEILTSHPLPALTLVGQHSSKPAILSCAGERALGSGAQVTTADKWQVASLTKSMTATLAARLVEKRAIHWDDTVEKTLVTIASDMHPSYRKATLRNLLTHRAGLRENVSVLDYVRFRKFNVDPRDERRHYVRKALGQRPLAAPGTVFGYSNNGYVVAAAMMEILTGKSWEELMRHELFVPLGMIDAGFGPPGRDDVIDQPRGHMRGLLGGKLQAMSPTSADADNPVAMSPCGGVHVSLRDMQRYLTAHRDRIDFLTGQSWAMLHTPPAGGDYAMGWFVRANGRMEHGGWNRRWIALASIDMKSGALAFTATNTGDRRHGHPAVEQAVSNARKAAIQG